MEPKVDPTPPTHIITVYIHEGGDPEAVLHDISRVTRGDESVYAIMERYDEARHGPDAPFTVMVTAIERVILGELITDRLGQTVAGEHSPDLFDALVKLGRKLGMAL